MALYDLTPTLRTRLNRTERIIGLFVIAATLLLLAGVSYYVYHTAKRKGWGTAKVPYFTMVDSTEGIFVGQPVKMMGFDVGFVSNIQLNAPEIMENFRALSIEFQIESPYEGYIWTDAEVRLQALGFGSSRYLEVIPMADKSVKKIDATYYTTNNVTYVLVKSDKEQEEVMKFLKSDSKKQYVPLPQYLSFLRGTKQKIHGYYLAAQEPRPYSQVVADILQKVDQALPGILNLTNQVAGSLSNSVELMAAFKLTASNTQPVLSNLTVITAQLKDPHGSLGEWLIPTQINQKIQLTVDSADTTVRSVRTNLNQLAVNLSRTLDNLADITANLNAQVRANSLILSEVSSLVISADEFLQGLKRHWLLKAAFGTQTNAPLESVVRPSIGINQ